MGAQPQDSWLLEAQPKIGLLRGFASVSMRLVLLVMLPLSVVFLFAFILEYRAEVRAERSRLVAQEAAVIQRRRLADEALRSFEAVRSAMMRTAFEGIVVMDEAGIRLEFNPSARRIFGYTREEVRGKPVADLIIPPAHREAHRLGLEHYLATGEGRIIDKHIDELTAIRKGGEEFPVELTVCPVMVAGKQLFCGFLRDLSERGRSETAAEPSADSSQA